jgi:hypothetical protein
LVPGFLLLIPALVSAAGVPGTASGTGPMVHRFGTNFSRALKFRSVKSYRSSFVFLTNII